MYLSTQVSNFDKEHISGLEAQCYCFALASLTVSMECSGLVTGNQVMEVHRLLNAHVQNVPQVI